MKKRLFAILIVFMLALSPTLMVGCKDNEQTEEPKSPIAVEGTDKEISLVLGQTATKSITVSDYINENGADNVSYSVSSSNTEVVSTSTISAGRFTVAGISVGNENVYLKAYQNDDEKVSIKFDVSVSQYNEPNAPFRIEGTDKNVSLELGGGSNTSKEITISDFIDENDANGVSYEVSSNDATKAQVSEIASGKFTITSQDLGNTTIVLKAIQGGEEKVRVEFLVSISAYIAPTGPSIKDGTDKTVSVTVDGGEDASHEIIISEFIDENEAVGSVSYSVSIENGKESLVSVSPISNGKFTITAIAKGNAVITLKAEAEGFSDVLVEFAVTIGDLDSLPELNPSAPQAESLCLTFNNEVSKEINLTKYINKNGATGIVYSVRIKSGSEYASVSAISNDKFTISAKSVGTAVVELKAEKDATTVLTVDFNITVSTTNFANSFYDASEWEMITDASYANNSGAIQGTTENGGGQSSAVGFKNSYNSIELASAPAENKITTLSFMLKSNTDLDGSRGGFDLQFATIMDGNEIESFYVLRQMYHNFYLGCSNGQWIANAKIEDIDVYHYDDWNRIDLKIDRTKSGKIEISVYINGALIVFAPSANSNDAVDDITLNEGVFVDAREDVLLGKWLNIKTNLNSEEIWLSPVHEGFTPIKLQNGKAIELNVYDQVGKTSETIDISEYIDENNATGVEYSVTSSAPSFASVSEISGKEFSISAVGKGSANVVLTIKHTNGTIWYVITFSVSVDDTTPVPTLKGNATDSFELDINSAENKTFKTITIADYINDADGTVYTVSIKSGNNYITLSDIVNTKESFTITVQGYSAGTATVELKATKGSYTPVTVTFTVTVENTTPVAEKIEDGGIVDLIIGGNTNEDTEVKTISEYIDLDGTTGYTISVRSNNATVATVALNDDSSPTSITITAKVKGSTSVYLEASKEGYATISIEFAITVTEPAQAGAPILKSDRPTDAISVDAYESAFNHTSGDIDIGAFIDENGASNVSYTVTTQDGEFFSIDDDNVSTAKKFTVTGIAEGSGKHLLISVFVNGGTAVLTLQLTVNVSDSTPILPTPKNPLPNADISLELTGVNYREIIISEWIDENGATGIVYTATATANSEKVALSNIKDGKFKIYGAQVGTATVDLSAQVGEHNPAEVSFNITITSTDLPDAFFNTNNWSQLANDGGGEGNAIHTDGSAIGFDYHNIGVNTGITATDNEATTLSFMVKPNATGWSIRFFAIDNDNNQTAPKYGLQHSTTDWGDVLAISKGNDWVAAVYCANLDGFAKGAWNRFDITADKKETGKLTISLYVNGTKVNFQSWGDDNSITYENTNVVDSAPLELGSYFQVKIWGNGIWFKPVFDPSSLDDINLVKIACVGDSLTQGHNAPQQVYTVKLQEELGEDYSVGNFGQNGASATGIGGSGETYQYKLLSQYRDSLNFNPDVITILLGSNDANGIKNSGGTKVGYETAMKELIDAYRRAFPNAKIIILTSPATFTNTFGIENEQLAFINDVQNSLNGYNGAIVHDLKTAMTGASGYGSDWFTDGVHLAEVANDFIASYLADIIRSL